MQLFTHSSGRFRPHTLPGLKTRVEHAALPKTPPKGRNRDAKGGSGVCDFGGKLLVQMLHDPNASVKFHTAQGETSRLLETPLRRIPHGMDVNDHLRVNIAPLRKARGMTPNDLAREAGINLRGVRDIEEGRSVSPKISTVVSLAKALGVRVSDLIGDEPVDKLRQELVDFLLNYSLEDQERLLVALQAMTAPKALPSPE